MDLILSVMGNDWRVLTWRVIWHDLCVKDQERTDCRGKIIYCLSNFKKLTTFLGNTHAPEHLSIHPFFLKGFNLTDM